MLIQTLPKLLMCVIVIRKMTSKSQQHFLTLFDVILSSFRFKDYLQKISQEDEHKTLIFAQTKRESDRIFLLMSQNGFVHVLYA